MDGISGAGRTQGGHGILNIFTKKPVTQNELNVIYADIKNSHDKKRQTDAVYDLSQSKKVSPEMKETMVQPLIDALGDITKTNSEARSRAAETLGILVNSKVDPKYLKDMVTPLITAAGDKNSDVRDSAVYSLGNLAASNIPSDSKLKIIDQLASMSLHDRDAGVKDNALGALRDCVQNTITSPIGISDLISMRDHLQGALEKKDAYGKLAHLDQGSKLAIDSLITVLDKKINM